MIMYKSIFRSKRLYILLSGVIVSAMSCDRGNSRKNIPPDTHLATDAINLSGDTPNLYCKILVIDVALKADKSQLS